MSKQKKVLLSWSSGKDSAWTLYQMQNRPDLEVVGLFSTVNTKYERVAMHAVRLELIEFQANAADLPIEIIGLPDPCSNQSYEKIMTGFVEKIKKKKIDAIAFGDLFLEDIRDYRIRNLVNTGIEALFPIWGIPTNELAISMLDNGLSACITCIDPSKLDTSFAGRVYDYSFVESLPANVDPCGEYGEFHSFAFSGPMFKKTINVRSGETVERDGFIFTDLLPV